MVKIVADAAIPWLNKLFAGHGEITCYDGRKIDHKMLKDADLLLTRATVKINKKLLQNTSVKLVASATVGCDHVNQKDLQESGVRFVHAPGCNANAVAEYVIAALAWHEKQGMLSFNQNFTAAVIGCGRIGSQVKQKLEVLGFKVIVNDPPLQLASSKGYSFVDLEQALQADVICLHTPLINNGEYPTYHLIDEHELDQVNPNAILINAGRGEVINNRALLNTLGENPNLKVVLDVWENEPDINWRLFNKVNLGTPHIAGHSWRGKVMGTVIIYKQICKIFNWPQQTIDENELKIPLPGFKLRCEHALYDVISQCYDIEADSHQLKSRIKDKTNKQAAIEFDNFRKNYYPRPEFSDLILKSGSAKLASQLGNLEFNKLSD